MLSTSKSQASIFFQKYFINLCKVLHNSAVKMACLFGVMLESDLIFCILIDFLESLPLKVECQFLRVVGAIFALYVMSHPSVCSVSSV